MYLKKLDIQGFKSFADKISMDFSGGITSVVGPNGSGKSNISDAIRWVLGEQSAKSLRGGKMEDCIFAGTEHRKPMGFADVTLTMDNSDSRMPYEFAEVTVTRRVYRSGESEYYINKTPCRLKDINELFFDTGIGKDGYSMIGQGRIDEILSTRSEERRLIFEEASGIMKYKVRKLEAERKIESTKQNMLRVQDILNELETQLGPLSEQSEKAKRFLNLREQLKEIEVSVFADNISRFKDKINEHLSQLEIANQDLQEQKLHTEKLHLENERKSEKIKETETELDSVREEYHRFINFIEKSESEIRIFQEKITNLEANIQRLDHETVELKEKINRFETDSTQREKKKQYLEKQFADFSQRLKESEEILSKMNELLDEDEKQIELLKASIMDKHEALSEKKMQAQAVSHQIESMIKKKNSMAAEKQTLILDKDRHFINYEELREQMAAITSALDKLTHSQEVLKKQIREKEELVRGLLEKSEKLNSTLQFKKSRYILLCDMEKTLEGYSRSVKGILTACRQWKDGGKGIHGALAQLITVDKQYETAIETTLGGSLQNIVTTTEEDAKSAIDYLKENKLGRATFLPISAVKGKRMEENLREIKAMPGYIGIASDLVHCDDVYMGIIQNLLGKVVVVDNLDCGIRMARQFRYSFRIVTLEGDLLNTSGAMSGGSSEAKGTGILSRHREIEELKSELEHLQVEIKQTTETVENEKKQLSTSQTLYSGKEDEIRKLEVEKVRVESNLKQEDAFLQSINGKIEMLQIESEELVHKLEEQKKDRKALEDAISAIEADIEKTRSLVSQNQDRFKASQSKRDEHRNDITDLKISVSSIQESLNSVQENMERIAEERQQSIKGLERRQLERTRNQNEIDASKSSINDLTKKIVDLNQAKTEMLSSMDEKNKDKQRLDDDLKRISEEIKDTAERFSSIQEEIGRIEIRKAKLEMESDALQNRMWEEYEITFSRALEYKKDFGSLTQATKAIEGFKSAIRDLGAVNVGAIEEYQKTRERHDFLAVQKADLEQAEEKLKRVIAEMTSIMKKQFSEQFKLINQNFNLVFRELFGGGRAELKLEDEENILESGIEIEVQPPGKKLQNMMLLSGGERAFTAIALLFGILRLKPSPFCILDEIEAALDDANVSRFANYLRKLAHETQFIMITHRKGTMEAADTLYGVTMQEHGVSRMVSLKMGEMVG